MSIPTVPSIAAIPSKKPEASAPSASAAPNPAEDLWRTIFGEGHPLLRSYQRFNKMLPADPRCKLCSAPFRGAGAHLMRLQGRSPSRKNPRFCSLCDTFIAKNPGGAEIELTMLFADVRGSTTLAEQMNPVEFGRLMNRFYAVSTQTLMQTDGFIDKYVGDEVIALYPPGFSGTDHAKVAIEAAESLLLAMGYGTQEGPWLPIGIGVHTGKAYLGTVHGDAGCVMDVTALGDNVNITARLASAARAGEALISDAACAASASRLDHLERRALDLRGKSEATSVYVMQKI